MAFETGAVPRVYDDVDEGDTRLDPRLLAGAPSASYRGGTVLMPAAIAPVLTSARMSATPAARYLAANAPQRIQIRVADSPASHASHAPAPAPMRQGFKHQPSRVEWAVAIGAGLFAAIVIGVVAALV